MTPGELSSAGSTFRERAIPRAPIAVCCLLHASFGLAGVTTDGRLGPVQSLSGQMTIGQDLGAAVGANLFHSFSTFSVDAGESATFTAIDRFDNVISRVTGGAPSGINGPLASTILNSTGGGANFWLVNPAGIVFGSGASLLLPGSFHASTADYLTLGDCAAGPAACGQFNATAPDTSTLSVAPPSAFGFLGPSSGAIQLDDAALEVRLNETFSLTGAGIDVSGGGISARSGDLRLTSVAGAGEVSTNSLDEGTVTEFGDVSLAGTVLVVDGVARLTPEGGILIRGGTVVVDGSDISSGDFGSVTGSGIRIQAADALTLSSGSRVALSNAASGIPGGIWLEGGEVRLTGSSEVKAEGIGSGPGAALAISGSDIVIDDGSSVSSSGLLSGSGDIVITAVGSLLIDGSGETPAGVSSTIQLGSIGNVGSVRVGAGELVSLVSGAQLTSTTAGLQDAGGIDVLGGDILIDGTLTPDRFTGISSRSVAGATGNAGAVTVTGDEITILGNGEVSSNTFSEGAAGSVAVDGRVILIDGTAGSRDKFTGISSSSEGGATGIAGAISVNGESTTLLGRGVISSNTSGSGAAGTVSVASGSLLIDGRSTPDSFTGISSDSTEGASGNAGAVTVTGDSITILGGGHVSSTAAGTGAGGQVTMTGVDILIDGSGVPVGITDISTRSLPGAAADAGGITVQGDSVTLLAGGQISNSTFNVGNAGQVQVSAGSILVDGNDAPVAQTGMFSQSNGGVSGNAGSITVEGGQVEIRDGGVIGSNTDGSGNAGAIDIHGVGGPDTGAVLLTVSGDGSGIISRTSGTGDGGEIMIRAESTTVSGGASVSAASEPPGGASPAADDSSRQNAGALGAPGSPRLGQAGSITLDSRNLAVLSGGTIGTTSATSGGGNITIRAQGNVLLDHGAVTASAQGVEAGDSGGNVSIARPAFLILDVGQIRADANAGRGGNITIDSVGFIASADSIISASSAQSVDGEVTNTSENTVGTIVEVEIPGVAPAEPNRTRCTAAQLQNRSSLVVRETRPGAVRSPYLSGDLAPGDVSAESMPCGAEIAGL